MAPPLSPEKGYIFRIAHAKNIPWILDHGLHCRNSAHPDPDYISIGNADLINKRNQRQVPLAPGGVLSDYVPFYFTPYSIMAYNIFTGHGVTHREKEEIVFLVSSIHKLVALDLAFVFTDRHAYPVNAYYFRDVADLEKIDWGILNKRSFNHDPEDPEKKERYQAEALIYQHVPMDAILGLACYNERVARWLKQETDARCLDLKTVCKQDWYF